VEFSDAVGSAPDRAAETKEGEAHSMSVSTIELNAAAVAATPELPPMPAWHALWTRSHCEQMVADQLGAKGFELFLPTVGCWTRRGDLRRRVSVPMFPGYVFLHGRVDKLAYLEIVKTRGLAQILGERWDRLATIEVREIQALRRIVDVGVPALPYAYLRAGQRVRITRGPLAEIEGVLVRTKENRGLLVVAVELLRRGVAVQVDCTSVTPL
jgi:transcription termination/antitermination protein NusG